ncbi:CU044_5270 family protein [Rhizohabitans arisaemae]|uniref:CU044_5270 family protein n=1 Tax=Rhizohabitans arisaemae TaxID=2720610 RepID=UPI0024B1D288|nr:CU044_5270 family protein [Rhizohabitans arisaemae]
MNDMTELKTLWSDIPEASAKELSGSRALLLRQTHASKRRTSPLRRYGLRLGLAGGLAAAMVGGVIVVQVGMGGSADQGGIGGILAAPPANAQQILKMAAQTALNDTLNPRPDQYLHTELRTTSYWQSPKGGKQVDATEERWTPVTGRKPSLVRETTPKIELPGLAVPAERGGTHDTLHIPTCTKPVDDSAQAGKLADWPTELNALRAKVQAEGAKYTAIPKRLRYWGAIQTLVNQAVLNPKLTAALLQLAQEIDGIEVDANATDAAGRPGFALGMVDDRGVKSQLVFDKQTYRYLGEQYVHGKDVQHSQRKPDGKEQTFTVPKGAKNGSAVIKVSLADSLPKVAENASKIKLPC